MQAELDHQMAIGLQTLDLNPRTVAALARGGIVTCADALHASSPELVRRGAISANAAAEVHTAAAEQVYRRDSITTAAELLAVPAQQTARLTTGCGVIDRALGGGILARGITEIVGESASAKTQICLQLLLTVQLPVEHGGLGGGAMFISTEDAFPTKRLQQLIGHSTVRWPALARVGDLGGAAYIEHSSSVADLLNIIEKRVILMLNRGVRLVILDSIAALFRVEFGVGDSVQRAKMMIRLSRSLKQLSDQYHTPVICINQVSDLVLPEGMGGRFNSRQVIPALGLAWSDMVNSRLFLQRHDRGAMAGGINMQPADAAVAVHTAAEVPRSLSVVLSSHLPPVKVGFTVGDDGVHGVSK